jgi:cephalosporin hydroxylase
VKALLRPLLGPPWRALKLLRAAGTLHRSAAPEAGDEALFDAVFACEPFRPLQKRAEFTALMARLRELKPALVMEIGSASGGTAFLFTRVAAPEATLILLDDAFGAARRLALRRFALPRQRIVTLRCDSHDPASLRRVHEVLAGRQLDFLFIDGDHSYEGAASDFSVYSPLVRPGGLVAFHDIVPDHASRFGRETVNRAGGVPRLWRELRQRYSSEELIEDPGQDACGLGLLRAAPFSPAGAPGS